MLGTIKFVESEEEDDSDDDLEELTSMENISSRETGSRKIET